MKTPFCLTLALCAVPGLRADVTIRYQSDLKVAPGVPAMMVGALKVPQDMGSIVIRLKGQKAHSAAGETIMIVDSARQEVTLIDAANKTFATFPESEFAGRVAAGISEEQLQAAKHAMAAVKTQVESRMTGQTAEIQGIQSEEREITISVDTPMPPHLPRNGATVKLVMQIWTAKQGELLRVPAMGELAAFSLSQKYLLNPAGMLSKITGGAPGASDTMAAIFEELYKNQSVILRTHVDMYMPIMAALAQHLAEQKGEPGPAIDPNSPVIQMNQEAVELSAGPVDASLFEVPAEYAAASADDLIRALILHKGTQVRDIKSETSSAPEGTPQRVHIGGEVQSAALIEKVDPEYPPLALQARVQGVVRFKLTIGMDGHVLDAQLISGHPVLVLAAKDAVMKWVYKPKLLNGKPVEVETTADISFTLSP